MPRFEDDISTNPSALWGNDREGYFSTLPSGVILSWGTNPFGLGPSKMERQLTGGDLLDHLVVQEEYAPDVQLRTYSPQPPRTEGTPDDAKPDYIIKEGASVEDVLQAVRKALDKAE